MNRELRPTTQGAGPLGRNTRRGHKTPMVRSQFPEADALADLGDALEGLRLLLSNWPTIWNVKGKERELRYSTMRIALSFGLELASSAFLKANVGRGNDTAKTPRPSRGARGAT